MTEMSQGLADDDEEAEGAGEAAPVPKPTKPKTRKQKLKAKALKVQELRRKKLKEQKKRMEEINRFVPIVPGFLQLVDAFWCLHRLRSIRREIRKAEERSQQRAEKRQKEKEAKLLKPAVLGRYKYEDPPVEVNLSEEITGSLRELKTEGLSFPSYKP